MAEPNTSPNLKFISIEGAPGSGKTNFGYQLAKAMQYSGQPILARDQVLFEEVRERPGRTLWAMIQKGVEQGFVAQEFKDQAQAILPDGRRALYETVAVDAVSALVQGSSVVSMVNWRPNDRPFFDLTYSLIEAFVPKPVEFIVVHLKSHADSDTNLKSIRERDAKIDPRDFQTIYGRTEAQLQAECAAWSEHGPGYIPRPINPEYRNYETLVLDRFKPKPLSHDELLAAYFAAKPQGLIVQPANSPQPELVGPGLRAALAGLEHLRR